jgi:hypothetical protein
MLDRSRDKVQRVGWVDPARPGQRGRSRREPMRQITKSEIDSIRVPWVWDLGNSVLYDLCRRHPGHSRDDEIVAKVWLIGRSYSASIERRRNAKDTGDRFYERAVVQAMRGSPVDEWLASVGLKDGPGCSASIAVHKKLMDLFRSITGLEKRSLASKYLHFHRPDAFFIYDSRARWAITKVVPRLNQLPAIEAEQHDVEYRDFVRRCVWLCGHVCTTHATELTPRELDKLLLMIADGGSSGPEGSAVPPRLTTVDTE